MPRTIKRYESRKLYDSAESRYVSLQEVAEWIRDGQEIEVIDTTTGVSKKVPWSEGLKISSASQTAKLQTATRALEIMRGTKKIKATAETLLQPGDVVRLK